MFRLFGSALACLLVLVALATTASAQAHEPPPEAMQLFEEAREQYRLGEYGPASENLERALMLDPSAPTLLFNLARVYELMGNFDQSISTYRRLLAVTPADQPAERERTQTTIDRLEGAREHMVAPSPPSAEERDDGPTFVRERGVADELFWIGITGAGAATIAAAILGGIAASNYGTAQGFTLGRDGTFEAREAEFAIARDLGLTTDIVGAVAATLFTASALLFALRERTVEVWRPGVAVTQNGAGLSVSGRW